MSATLRVADEITELMGNTPMLRLRRVSRPEWAAVYAKLEFLNPGGSVKDRAALGMILDAERLCRRKMHSDARIRRNGDPDA
jgi:cysteine synthase